MRNVWSIFLGALLLAGFGCGKNSTDNKASGNAPASAAASTNRQVYQVRGVVKEILSPKKVKVAHEEIPGYMVAMTMPFDVKNTNELNGIAAGDKIAFDMVVTDDDGWIEKIAKVATAPGTNSPAPAAEAKTNEVATFRRVREVDPLSIGDKMPDYPFVTEEGKAIRLSDLKGQAIGFTFIFTRCPFPTFCPRISANFEKVAAQMATSGVTNWHLLSISFDPRFDTPERLKDHAQRFQRDPAKWNFVTGEMIEIDAITEQFGLIFANRNGTIDHNLRSVIVDASGVIRQIFVGNEWMVTEFVDEMVKAAKGAAVEGKEAAAKGAETPAKPAP